MEFTGFQVDDVILTGVINPPVVPYAVEEKWYKELLKLRKNDQSVVNLYGVVTWIAQNVKLMRSFSTTASDELIIPFLPIFDQFIASYVLTLQ